MDTSVAEEEGRNISLRCRVSGVAIIISIINIIITIINININIIIIIISNFLNCDLSVISMIFQFPYLVPS